MVVGTAYGDRSIEDKSDIWETKDKPTTTVPESQQQQQQQTTPNAGTVTQPSSKKP